jgi:hypothetical protein
MNLHVSKATRRILAAAAVTCAAAATPAMALASTSGHPGLPGAGAKAARHQTTTNPTNCTYEGPYFFYVTKSGANYYLGAPNTVTSGKAAILKSKQNRETSWTLCFSNTASTAVIENGGDGGMALTSRATSPGATVTFESAGNGGNGYTSQQWAYSSGNPVTFQNVKTGLYLRVPNTGPIMGQAVTTGSTPTPWNWIFQ